MSKVRRRIGKKSDGLENLTTIIFLKTLRCLKHPFSFLAPKEITLLIPFLLLSFLALLQMQIDCSV